MRKTIVITAGGTVEPIDGVRSITNASTGRLGATICNEMIRNKLEEIDRIYYMCSEQAVKPEENAKIKLIIIKSVNDLKEQTEKLLKYEHINVFIHSMAVSDYITKDVTNAKMLSAYLAQKIDRSLSNKELEKQIEELIKNNLNKIDTKTKISSYEKDLIISLEETPKIISMIKNIDPNVYLVGFKLLNDVTEEELCMVAYQLLEKNNCNLVVANDLKNITKEKHEAILMDEKNNRIYANTKQDIAEKLIKKIWGF